jgi:hypothetical protein
MAITHEPVAVLGIGAIGHEMAASALRAWLTNRSRPLIKVSVSRI